MNLKRFSRTLKHIFLKIKYKLDNYFSIKEKNLISVFRKFRKFSPGSKGLKASYLILPKMVLVKITRVSLFKNFPRRVLYNVYKRFRHFSSLPKKNNRNIIIKYLKNLKIFPWKKRRFRLRWDSSPGLSIAGRLL